jgi:hypothetical protein
MSGHIGGHSGTLPFTGLATLPLVIGGLIVGAVGFLLTLVKPKQTLA